MSNFEEYSLRTFPFLYPATWSGGVLWYHFGRPCEFLSYKFLFPDDNLSEYQWIFTNLGKCIDIVEIWTANGQISSIFDRALPESCPYFHLRIIISSMSVDFHQLWYMHWYCGDLVLVLLECLWANFVNFYLPVTRYWEFSVFSASAVILKIRSTSPKSKMFFVMFPILWKFDKNLTTSSQDVV